MGCGLGALSCLSLEPEPPPVLEVAEVRPSSVGPSEAFELRLSTPVGLVPEPALRVVTEPSGSGVAAQVDWVGPDLLWVRPSPSWPESLLSVELLDGFESIEGRSFLSGTGVNVSVEPKPVPPPQLWLAAPPPGAIAPANLAAVVVGLRPVDSAAEVDRVTVSSSEGEVHFSVTGVFDGLVRATGAPRCPPLCPGAEVHVSAPGFDGPSGMNRFRVGGQKDERAPRGAAVQTQGHADGVRVIFPLDEPGWVEVWMPEAPRARARGFVFGMKQVEGQLVGLTADRPVTVRARAYDLAGNGRDLPRFTVRRPRTPDLQIQELVCQPLRDWGDSRPAGVPFDGLPGDGSVSDADEWVELVNRSEEPVDLRAFEVTLFSLDGSPAATPLMGAPGLYFGARGTKMQWGPGEALVLRPRGSMSCSDLVLRLVSGGVELDRVELGPAGVHPGGGPPDAMHEALARDGRGRWRWCVPSPGDPLPPVRCIDG